MSPSIIETTLPVVATVADSGLRDALSAAFAASTTALSQVEAGFAKFAQQTWPVELRRQFMKSWHSTHLKMLPIYGLSCRLQKRAMQATGETQHHYLMAAVHNAETSYEDLSVEMPEWRTHSELFEDLANTLCEGDDWKLNRYCLPRANEFRAWIYHNMVMGDLETGLLTNMFSEIYNHGEYSHALAPFVHLMQTHYDLSAEQSKRLALYIECHVESDVEENHFNCVVNAMQHYNQAESRSMNYDKARQLFTEYLSHAGAVMAALEMQFNAAS